MRFLNRHFFAGVATGVVLTVALIVAGFAGYTYWIMHGPPERYARVLTPPFFPRVDSLETYGVADSSFRVTALDGTDATLGELRGRTVFFNVWATWCLPCIAEMPSIEALRASLADTNVVFVLVANQDAGHVKKFAVEKGFDLPFYSCEGDLPEDLRPGIIPTTYIIDPAGRIVYRHAGSADWNDDRTRVFFQDLGSVRGR